MDLRFRTRWVSAGTARLRFWTWKPGTTGSLLVDDVVVNKN